MSFTPMDILLGDFQNDFVGNFRFPDMIDFAIEGTIIGRTRVRFGEGKSTVSHSGTFGEEADERTTSCRGRIELA